MFATDVQIVPTTPRFRAGQAAAKADAARDAETVPNDAVLGRMPAEFAAGYRYEFENYIAPMRLVTAAR